MGVAVRFRSIAVVGAIAFLWLALSACSRVHIYQADPATPAVRPRGNDPWTEWEDRTLTTFLWGVVRQDLPITNCRTGDNTPTGIHEVRVSKNLGQRLITVFSLGLIDPVSYGWRCQRPPARGGRLE